MILVGGQPEPFCGHQVCLWLWETPARPRRNGRSAFGVSPLWRPGRNSLPTTHQPGCHPGADVARRKATDSAGRAAHRSVISGRPTGRSHPPAISEKVILARPGLAAIEKAVDTKTASMLIDFLHEFSQRPLRGLTFDEALLTYAERQLGDGM